MYGRDLESNSLNFKYQSFQTTLIFLRWLTLVFGRNAFQELSSQMNLQLRKNKNKIIWYTVCDVSQHNGFPSALLTCVFEVDSNVRPLVRVGIYTVTLPKTLIYRRTKLRRRTTWKTQFVNSRAACTGWFSKRNLRRKKVIRKCSLCKTSRAFFTQPLTNLSCAITAE